MAVSIDDVEGSGKWAAKRGFAFPLLSDPDLALMAGTYHIRSPFDPDLPLHSTYIIGAKREVVYRKNGGSRPSVQELLDALDYYRATHPAR